MMPKNKHGVKPDRDNRTASSGVDDKRRHVIARIDAAVCKQTRPCFSKGGGRCFLTKCGAARAPENAPVCNMGGLALARPVGEMSEVRKLNVLTTRNDYGQQHF